MGGLYSSRKKCQNFLPHKTCVWENYKMDLNTIRCGTPLKLNWFLYETRENPPVVPLVVSEPVNVSIFVYFCHLLVFGNRKMPESLNFTLGICPHTSLIGNFISHLVIFFLSRKTTKPKLSRISHGKESLQNSLGINACKNKFRIEPREPVSARNRKLIFMKGPVF